MKKNLHIIIISFLFSVILWISISLSNEYYATFKVPLKLVDFSSGLTSGTRIPKEVSVKVKGKGWKLISARIGSESDYIVTATGDAGIKYINLYNYLSENRWLSSDVEVIDISPDTLTFNIEKMSGKKLQILPDVDLSFRDGYGLASPVIVVPDSQLVYGPSSSLKNMNSIMTEKITITNLSEKYSVAVNLKSLPGMNLGEGQVQVNIDVQKIVDKNFDDVIVNVIDVPADREVLILPNKITVNVSGGIDILGRLTSNDFKAFINYRDVVLDTLGGIIPQIESPLNATIKFMKPDQLRYVIKKFN